MILNRWYGFGIVAAVAHKLLMDQLLKYQEAPGNNIANNFLGVLANILGLDNPHPPRNNIQQTISRLVDKSLPLLSLGIALNRPGWSAFLGISHILMKYCQIRVRNQQRDPRVRNQLNNFISVVVGVLFGGSLFWLIEPIFYQEVKSNW